MRYIFVPVDLEESSHFRKHFLSVYGHKDIRIYILDIRISCEEGMLISN